MFDEIIKKNSNSSKKLNIGGGLGGNEDSLYSFKTRFSKRTQKFSTIRAILDVDKYNLLTKDFSKEARDEHNRRVAHLSKLLLKHNVPMGVSLISPYK